MVIGSIASAAYPTIDRRRSDSPRDRRQAERPDVSIPASRALVPVSGARWAEAAGLGTRVPREAALIAQLLATRAGLAQTRERRRASPAEASAAYAAPVRGPAQRTRTIV